MKKLEKGFTLIELMIVVAIIAILAAVAAPKFGDQLKKAKDGKAIQIVGNWRSALTMQYADDTTYATTFSGLTKYVDTKTADKTFAEVGRTNKFSTGTNAATNNAYVEAGTSDLGTAKNSVLFSITGTAVDASIVFSSTNGNDAKGTSWSAY